MIDRGGLTKALAREVTTLEDDLRDRATTVPEIGDAIEDEWRTALNAGRTELELGQWRDGLLTQVAVGWVLSSVFIRFGEDNGLLPEPRLSGPGDRRRRAEDAQTVYFREHPAAGERDYLRSVFESAALLPGLAEVLGPHNPVWRFAPSDDACRHLLQEVWRAQEPETGDLVWDFTDPTWDTRFLGDLYQDLSESARKTYALLQTPDFIEEFILDRTLDPAVDEFGLDGFRMIDPACGSGHFLLGAFARLFERWRERRSDLGDRALAEQALQSVHGVDLNPFAVAIARFRLLAAALQAAGIATLAEAPAFSLQVATGDSLLHGPAPGQQSMLAVDEQDPATRHLFATEDGDAVTRILSQRYHAVVANPPYITPKDPAANAAYRRRYATTHRQYALSVPFMERIFDLAERGDRERPAGFTGQITANSFMKREFGKKLIEDFLAGKVDLTHVIDTSGAYIPGHGTPTVILFGRNRRPVGDSVRAVLGIRGEPAKPADPAKGQVWSSIADLVDEAGSENEFVSVVDLLRDRLRHHPWSLQGGAASPLIELLESSGGSALQDHVDDDGRTAHIGEDDAYLIPAGGFGERRRLDSAPFVVGESVRDYSVGADVAALFPYAPDGTSKSVLPIASAHRLWPSRQLLRSRMNYGKSADERGIPWWEYSFFLPRRFAVGPFLTYAFVATHNHFVFDRGGKVFNRSAPVIKLPEGATDDDHLQLLGLLNSSTACFWMQQVFHNKGGPGGGSTKDEKWHDFYEFDGTKLKRFPLAEGDVRPWAQWLDSAAEELAAAIDDARTSPSESLTRAQNEIDRIRQTMVSAQEELDWHCYYLYGLTDVDLSVPPEVAPPIARGDRAFEILLAQALEAGSITTRWFEHIGFDPITELPTHWPEDYRRLVERRIELIESDRFIGLLERPEYKRRWNWESWDSIQERVLRGWLLDRLEAPELWAGGQLRSVAQLADALRTDAEFVAVAERYAESPEVDLADLLARLVAAEAVPYLAAWRYTDSGLRKRRAWEDTWALQRREDAGEDVGRIPVPPKYAKTDFRAAASWTLRGKLDVPKERFVSYLGLSREVDSSLVLGWAGWDHLQQAQALAAWYEARRTGDGWSAEQLLPALAGLDELVPWLQQWHNDLDAASGQRLGDFFDGFVAAQCATLGVPREALAEWRPPAPARGRKKKTS